MGFFFIIIRLSVHNDDLIVNFIPKKKKKTTIDG